MNNNKVPVIAVDGPSGAGKGTIAKKLAKKFNFHYLDSGALYRVLALAAKKHMVDVTNASALEVLAAHMDVQFEIRDPGQQELVIFEGEEVNELYSQALAIVRKERKASTSFLQRCLKIGYNRAADLIDQLEKNGVVSAANHVGRREVLLPEDA